MVILLDNGHGVTTPGKRSPDGRLLEWSYSRDIAKRIERKLANLGIEVRRIVPEQADVPLNRGKDSRVARVNAICREADVRDAILISIHCNAAGSDGKWHDARGWSVFVAQNASERSKQLANLLFDEAKKAGLKMRQPLPTQKYWVQSLAICRDTSCPAVLTENLFQDNLADVEYLLSETGRETISELHVAAIMKFILLKA
jgi:N-acetylmuramoyl-L-alanine amidase